MVAPSRFPLREPSSWVGCVAQSGARATRGSRLPSWYLRAILAALVIAVLMPAMAAAQTEAPAAPELVPVLGDLEPVIVDPPAESPAPADEVTPPPADEVVPPPVEPPAAEQPQPPAPTEPATPPAPPAETTPPPPAAEGPAAAPAPLEASPVPAATPGLPGAPDAPRARPEAVLGPVVVDAGADVGKPLPAIAVKVTGGPTPPPTALDTSGLGSPTAPPGLGLSATEPAPLGEGVAVPRMLPELSPSLLEEPAAPAAPSRRDVVVRPGAEAVQPGTNPFDTVAAPGGPPGGSSLLAALASYVIPGGGAPPATVLLLLVQLAVILAAFFAPRPGLGERALALARLGPRSGYRTVLARPG
jgi:hypothetical protein